MNTRRSFLTHGVLATAAIFSPTALSAARVAGANEKIRLGFVGLGSRGQQSTSWFAGIPNVEIAYLCDADLHHINMTKQRFPQAKTTQDMRQVFDDPEIDAVVVSTCNHWHVLASIWACQAGKDVYVEKPVSHNIWEGRKLVEAARKYHRIVQCGTQQRSDPFQRELKEFLDSGDLGKIQYVRCNHYGVRGSIGKRDKPLVPPGSLDYDRWLGPAKDEPIYRNQLHYDWHWSWNTGNGEMGNWGPHLLDDVRNVVFRDKIGMPRKVLAGGGRFGWNDAGETPNTHFLCIDTGDVPVIMDVHNLPRQKGTNAPDIYRRRRTGAFLIIECENGYYAGGRGGGSAHEPDGKLIRRFSGDGGGKHAENFIAAVRSRKSADLAAEIEQGHYSSAWCHLANVSLRLGKDGDPDMAKAQLKNFEPWQELVGELPDHLKANEITLKPGEFRMGQLLEIDPTKETLIGDSATPEGLALFKREYRKGFEVPDKV